MTIEMLNSIPQVHRLLPDFKVSASSSRTLEVGHHETILGPLALLRVHKREL